MKETLEQISKAIAGIESYLASSFQEENKSERLALILARDQLKNTRVILISALSCSVELKEPIA